MIADGNFHVAWTDAGLNGALQLVNLLFALLWYKAFERCLNNYRSIIFDRHLNFLFSYIASKKLYKLFTFIS